MNHKILVWALLITVLAACGGPAPAAPPSLDGTVWVLQLLHGRPLVVGSHITLSFASGQLSGSAGCNSYGGSYTAQGDRLTFGTMVRTEMYCMDPAGVMDQEDAFLAALATVTHYRMAPTGPELLDDAGQVVLTLAYIPPAPTAAK